MRLEHCFLHGVLGRRELVPAADDGAQHLGSEDAQCVVAHSVTAGTLLITGRTSIHS